MIPTATDIEAIYRAESGRVLASLIRLLGGFELAEEALHEAFAAAAAQWPRDGLPKNPRAWLVSAGRFKAIDRLRRKARFHREVEEELSRRLADEMTILAITHRKTVIAPGDVVVELTPEGVSERIAA